MTAFPHEPADDEGDRPLPSHLRGALSDVRTTRDAVLLLSALHELGRSAPAFAAGLEPADDAGPDTDAGTVRALGRARKVSVSLPEGLTAAVQRRVGRGEFSRYVADAVTRQLELDLVAELAELLRGEHGPVSEELLAEAGAAWPDAE